MPEISIPASTLEQLQLRARAHGFSSLLEYLADLANESEDQEFTMTPALSAALDKGLADLKNGQVLSAGAVREDIKRLGQEWRARNG